MQGRQKYDREFKQSAVELAQTSGKSIAELVHHARFGSTGKARAQIFHYIEAFYNHKRLHSSLGYRSPNAFEANAMKGS